MYLKKRFLLNLKLLLCVLMLSYISAYGEHLPAKILELRKHNYPVNRHVPIADNIVIVKRIPTIAKSAGYDWNQTIRDIKVENIKVLFTHGKSDRRNLRDIYQLNLRAGSDVYAAIHELMKDPTVVWAEPSYLCYKFYEPSDLGLSQQWYLDKINVFDAWETLAGSGEVVLQDTNVVIAIVDDGIHRNHPDLRGNIWINEKEIPDNNMDDDDNGFVDDVYGWDFGDEDNDVVPDEYPDEDVLVGHGTLVAGVASAVTNNQLGMAAPAFNAKLMAVKTSRKIDDPQSSLLSNGLLGVVYAAENGADIINCSWGHKGASNYERAIMDFAESQGAVVISSSGNTSVDTLEYPASYRNVMSVAATDQNDKKAGFSTFNRNVDISAPGVEMYTTYEYAIFQEVQGTSFSSPLVASVAALLKGIHPDWTNEQVREQVRVTADPIDHLNPNYYRQMGSGRLNAYRAVTEVLPGLRIFEAELRDAQTGNEDNIPAPGEVLNVVFKIRNYLAEATNLVLTLTCNHPDIDVLDGSLQITSLGTLDSLITDEGQFRIQVAENPVSDDAVELFLKIEADGGYQDWDFYTFDMQLGYTIEGGNVALTLSSDGNLGYTDFNNNQQGVGFIYGNSKSMLYEGSFMAGISESQLSDEARTAFGQDEDFEMLPFSSITVQKPGVWGDVQGEVVFTDNSADKPIGLEIKQTSLGYNNAPDNDYIILIYDILNRSDDAIEGLYLGHYMDWDMGSNAALNFPGFNNDYNLAYIWGSGSMYAGTQVLSSPGATGYQYIDNFQDLDPYYTDELKWLHMSGGIESSEPTSSQDYSYVLSTGPFTLNATDTLRVGFSVLAGIGESDMEKNAKAAQNKWNSLFGGGTGSEVQTVTLKQNYPNPFPSKSASTTTIEYGISSRNRVVIKVYNILGQEVITLLDEEKDPGNGQVIWDGYARSGMAANGVYLYRIESGSKRVTKKMVFIR